MNAETRKRFDEAVYYKEKRDLKKSEKIFLELAEKNPDSVAILAVWGHLYWDFDQFEKAVALFRKAVSLAPLSETMSLALFHSLWNSDRRDEALDEAKRFLSHSDSSDYREIIEEINEKW